MAVTLTSADKALKSLYLDVVAEQLNFKVNPLLAQIKQNSDDVWGKEVRKLAQAQEHKIRMLKGHLLEAEKRTQILI